MTASVFDASGFLAIRRSRYLDYANVFSLSFLKNRRRGKEHGVKGAGVGVKGADVA